MRIKEPSDWRGETLARSRVSFEHTRFDMWQPWAEQAYRGAEFGWVKIRERLPGVVGALRGSKGG